ncbi:MAG: long-chain fatty acid--CoA ligase [Chloroflexi bacterium]|nr:MAG: long-chain fatty acid--CoA ligase [Chloroflexota bacterium]
MNVYDICAIPASIEPDRECLVSGRLRLSYAALDAWTARLAERLRDHAGRRIAIIDINSPGLVALLLACWRAGCVAVPFNVRARGEELAYLLHQAEAPVIFAGERYRDALAAAGASTGAVEAMPRPLAAAPSSDPTPAPADLSEDTVAIGLFTSGSTARPKLIEISHANLLAHVVATTELLNNSGSAVVVAAPLFHIAALGSICTGLFSGRRLVLLDEFDPERWLSAVEAEAATHAFLVPTMLGRLIDHPAFDAGRLRSLTTLSYGAAPMPPALLERCLERFPDSVGFANGFGQTETTSTVTLLGPDDHRLVGSPEEIALRRRRLHSVGRAISGVEVAVLDDDGRSLPPGQVGEVAVRGDRVVRGREGGPGAAGRDGWLRTRDLGYLDEDGYLFLAGRADDMMIRAGENIAPVEVEAVLASHPDVAEAAVAGIPDDDVGERVGAAVIARPGHSIDVADLVRHAAARLAAFKRPELVAVVDELPRSPLGKVQRPRLRELLQREGRPVTTTAGGG